MPRRHPSTKHRPKLQCGPIRARNSQVDRSNRRTAADKSASPISNNFHMHVEKTKVYWPTINLNPQTISPHTNELPINMVTCGGVELLGAPIASQEFMGKKLHDKLVPPDFSHPYAENLDKDQILAYDRFNNVPFPPQRPNKFVYRFDTAGTAFFHSHHWSMPLTDPV